MFNEKNLFNQYPKKKAYDEAHKIKEMVGGDESTKEDLEKASRKMDIKTGFNIVEEQRDLVPPFFDVDEKINDASKALAGAGLDKAEVLEQISSNPGFLAAKRVVDARESLDKNTEKMLPPEKLDFLTSILQDELPWGELAKKEEITDRRHGLMRTELNELMFQLGALSSYPLEKIQDYLEKNLERRKKLIERLDKYFADEEKLPIELRAHQDKALKKIRDFIDDGNLRGFISHFTGAGKTVLFGSLTKVTDARALIIVPKRSLVSQTIKSLKRITPDKKITYVGTIDEEQMKDIAPKGTDGDIVVIVEDSFKNNSLELKEKDFDFVFWDEMHNSYTDNSQTALRYFPSSIKIGFSATPDYLYTKKGKGMEEIKVEDKTYYIDPSKTAKTYYPHEIDHITLKEGINEGLASPLAVASIKVEMDTDELFKNKNGGDFSEKDLDNFYGRNWPAMKAAAIDTFINGIPGDPNNPEDPENRIYFDDKQIFSVCYRVEHAKEMAEESNNIYDLIKKSDSVEIFLEKLQEKGTKIRSKERIKKLYEEHHDKEYNSFAAVVTGDTSEEERDKIFNDYAEKKIKSLFSVGVLKEGWDCPQAEVLLMQRMTKSRLFYEQVLGRVTRLNDDDPCKVALAVDFAGSYSELSPLTAVALIGRYKYYNGQVIASAELGDLEEEDSEQPKISKLNTKNLAVKNRYNVGTTLIAIERVSPPREVEEGVAEQNGDAYFSTKRIEEMFHASGKLLSNIRKVAKTVKIGNTAYYEIRPIIDHFLSNKIKLNGHLTIKDVADAIGIDMNYLINNDALKIHFRNLTKDTKIKEGNLDKMITDKIIDEIADNIVTFTLRFREEIPKLDQTASSAFTRLKINQSPIENLSENGDNNGDSLKENFRRQFLENKKLVEKKELKFGIFHQHKEGENIYWATTEKGKIFIVLKDERQPQTSKNPYFFQVTESNLKIHEAVYFVKLIEPFPEDSHGAIINNEQIISMLSDFVRTGNSVKESSARKVLRKIRIISYNEKLRSKIDLVCDKWAGNQSIKRECDRLKKELEELNPASRKR